MSNMAAFEAICLIKLREIAEEYQRAYPGGSDLNILLRTDPKENRVIFYNAFHGRDRWHGVNVNEPLVEDAENEEAP